MSQVRFEKATDVTATGVRANEETGFLPHTSELEIVKQGPVAVGLL